MYILYLNNMRSSGEYCDTAADSSDVSDHCPTSGFEASSIK